jgi:competence protein ComGC
MKATALPSNLMVYLAITVIVIAVVVILMLLYTPGENYLLLMKKGCLELIKDCNKDLDTIIIENEKPYSLGELCSLNNIKSENCAKSCGC